jgi:hypothetical protein
MLTSRTTASNTALAIMSSACWPSAASDTS